jgi:hypothetical protein
MKSLQQQINESIENNTTVEEGIFDVFKMRKQFTQLQGAVMDMVEEIIENNPKKYRDGNQVMNAVWQDARKLYDKFITMDGAMTFNQWWKEFSGANARFLDMTTFKMK